MVLPRGITVRKPHLVRGLATALCALPKMPRGPVSCPAQFGGSLQLAFAAGGRPLRPVIVQMSGCRMVSGLGPARAVPSAAFWRTLGNDLGLKCAKSPAWFQAARVRASPATCPGPPPPT